MNEGEREGAKFLDPDEGHGVNAGLLLAFLDEVIVQLAGAEYNALHFCTALLRFEVEVVQHGLETRSGRHVGQMGRRGLSTFHQRSTLFRIQT